MTIDSVNPATGEVVASYPEMDLAEVGGVIERAREAFLGWRETPFAERARHLRAAARILEEEADDFGALMAREMGKPIAAGRSEAKKCAWVCAHYAEHAESLLARREVSTDARRSYVSFQPLGVVLAVMPWNFPFWQVFRFAAPGLAAGNAGVLKHASNVFGCALAIEDVFRRAGFPADLFRALLVGSSRIDAVIEHPLIAAATLTGSVPAGRAVAAKAGGELKKTVLELGGSDPYLVLADADLEAAVESCVESRLINSGQSCIAAKRFIVVAAVADRFVAGFVERMRAKRMGDPLDEANDLGPQARSDLRDDLHRQVRATVDAGAELLLGGEVPDGPGALLPAHRPRPRDPRHAGLRRGDLRPGGGDRPRRRRRGGDPPGQRLAVRPRRRRLHPRPRARRGDRRAPVGGRLLLRQRLRQERSAPAVRRGQGVGLRPRARRAGDPRVRQRQDRLGGVEGPFLPL